jgi:hypothetical protein
MSTETVISMRELEAESAELLPSRETLCAPRCGGHSSYSYTSVTSQSYDGNGIANILNGSNFLNNDNIAVVVG